MGFFKRLMGIEPQESARESPHPSAVDVGLEASHESWYVTTDDPERFQSDPLPLRLIEYSDSTGEKVLRLCEDRTGLLVGPTDRRLAKVGVYVSQLRGEVYHRDGCRLGDFSPGSAVQLRPEPDNPHDAHAVAVFDATGTHQAAYVNKQKARAIGKLLDAGKPLEAISIRGTRAGTPCDQVAILAAAPDLLAHLRRPRPPDAPAPDTLAEPLSAWMIGGR